MDLSFKTHRHRTPSRHGSRYPTPSVYPPSTTTDPDPSRTSLPTGKGPNDDRVTIQRGEDLLSLDRGWGRTVQEGGPDPVNSRTGETPPPTGPEEGPCPVRRGTSFLDSWIAHGDQARETPKEIFSPHSCGLSAWPYLSTVPMSLEGRGRGPHGRQRRGPDNSSSGHGLIPSNHSPRTPEWSIYHNTSSLVNPPDSELCPSAPPSTVGWVGSRERRGESPVYHLSLR